MFVRSSLCTRHAQTPTHTYTQIWKCIRIQSSTLYTTIWESKPTIKYGQLHRNSLLHATNTKLYKTRFFFIVCPFTSPTAPALKILTSNLHHPLSLLEHHNRNITNIIFKLLQNPRAYFQTETLALALKIICDQPQESPLWKNDFNMNHQCFVELGQHLWYIQKTGGYWAKQKGKTKKEKEKEKWLLFKWLYLICTVYNLDY